MLWQWDPRPPDLVDHLPAMAVMTKYFLYVQVANSQRCVLEVKLVAAQKLVGGAKGIGLECYLPFSVHLMIDYDWLELVCALEMGHT